MYEIPTDDEYIINANRKAKQSFLKEEIIDMDFNPDDFIQFASQQKGSADIDNWSFEELQDIVRTFKVTIRDRARAEKKNAKKAKPKAAQENTEEEKQPEVQEPPQSEIQTPPVPNPRAARMSYRPCVESDGSDDESTKPQTIELHVERPSVQDGAYELGPDNTLSCKWHRGSELGALKEEVQLTIKGFQKMTGSVFDRPYARYIIQTEPVGWLVTRRFNDFLWFRESLAIKYPGVYLPPLPKNHTRGILSDVFLSKRKASLETFLCNIIANDFLRSAPIVDMFLHVDDEEKWKTILETPVQKPETLHDFYAPDGEITLDFGQNGQIFDEYQEHLGMMEILRKRAKKQSDQLIAELVQTSTTLSNLAVTFSQLEQLQTNLPAFERLQTVYSEVSETLARWSQSSKEQIEIAKTRLSRFFSYGRKEIPCQRLFLKERQTYLGNLKKDLRALNDKKEEMWKKGDTTTWEVDTELDAAVIGTKDTALEAMLPKENSELKKQEQIYAYFNYSTKCELNRLAALRVQNEIKHFGRYSEEMVKHYTNKVEAWDGLKKSMEEIYTLNR